MKKYLIFIIVAVAIVFIYKWRVDKNTKTIIISIAALCISFLVIYDRLIPPTVKITDITPICFVNARDDLKYKDWPTPEEYSLYFIVNAKSTGRPVYINAIDISGKLGLSPNDYLGLHTHEGRNISDVADEYKAKKPYYHIAWSAWPSNEKDAIKLEAHESRLLLFTLLEPSLSGQRESGYIVPREDYVGYEHENIKPKRKNSYPSRSDYFEYKLINNHFQLIGLKPDFQNGRVIFNIRLGDKTIRVHHNKINRLKVFPNKDKDSTSLEELYSRGDNLLK